MKKLFLILIAGLLIMSCKRDKDYVTISGEITNPNSSEIKIINPEKGKEPIKVMALNDKGAFSDTLYIPKGNYILSDGTEYANLFLAPGADIHLTLDTKEFDETLTYTGKGSEVNNYIIKKLLAEESFFTNNPDLFDLPKEEFAKKLEEFKLQVQKLQDETKNLDSDFVASEKEESTQMFDHYNKVYESKLKMKTMVGKPSPKFKDYENHKGGTTSLDDLKGKYVYVDVWATWCKPCLAEIPALKELEKELGDKIHFLSISIDEEKARNKWKKMVDEKKLKGVQLIADKDWDSEFITGYFINGIPRFILIDPQGNVVNPDAPRPSDGETKALLVGLVN